MAEVPLPTPTDNPVPSTDIRDAVYAGAMLDKVVTSTELTYTDRLGGEHYTVDGIKAEGDKVVEETRQNLIPLSRQYMTLAAAQADIANIPEGSATYYRSPDDSALAVEVINNGGTLQETGRKMPSTELVNAKVSAAYEDLNAKIGSTNVLLSEISALPLTKFTSITMPGDTVVNIGKESVLRINSLSAAETPDARNQKNTLKVTDLQSGVTTTVAELLPAEYFADNVL
ncbi:flagellar biosynthesis, cell-distal portion of basal-body rod [Klebsiella pneumoniae]|nr:flagellar biosynthesis, cell-distal portion of basal-body rod [Klebsiella pneumoniae]